MRDFQRMPEIREDFVDPADVWDPELTPPIAKIIGSLIVIALIMGIAPWGFSALGGLAFFPVIGVGYGLGQIAVSAPRLRSYLRYEAWMASPAPAPRHIGALIVGGVLLLTIAVEILLTCKALLAP